MRKLVLVLIVVFAGISLVCGSAQAYNFGDFRSETLTVKAWEALSNNDIEAVLAYTNKCLELYAEQAMEMQNDLSDYIEGPKEKVFAQWALNDVSTSLFVQGEAYRRAGKGKEAIKVFKRLINDYSYGQTWDSNGWFWKPAKAAKEKIAMIDSGVELDFGDYSSAFLVGQAWRALPSGDVKVVTSYTDKVIELYAEKAKEMQGSLTEYPWQSKEQVFNHWALNDVGTALFIKGEVLNKAGEAKEAKVAYKQLISDFYYSQCWDPQGWFWKPSEAAQEKLADM